MSLRRNHIWPIRSWGQWLLVLEGRCPRRRHHMMIIIVVRHALLSRGRLCVWQSGYSHGTCKDWRREVVGASSLSALWLLFANFLHRRSQKLESHRARVWNSHGESIHGSLVHFHLFLLFAIFFQAWRPASSHIIAPLHKLTSNWNLARVLSITILSSEDTQCIVNIVLFRITFCLTQVCWLHNWFNSFLLRAKWADPDQDTVALGLCHPHVCFCCFFCYVYLHWVDVF